MAAASKADHLHICLWLRDRGVPWDSALANAARAGRRNACERLLAAGCFPQPHDAYCAASGGHVGLMDWLLTLVPQRVMGRYGADKIVEGACCGCDLSTLQRLLTVWLPAALQRRVAEGAAVEPPQVLLSEASQRTCLANATCSPTPDWRSKVEYLEGLFPDLPRPECAEVAALPDAVERLAWLRGRGYPLGNRTVVGAAKADSTATVTYLLDEVGVQVANGEAATTAARRGHLAVLQLLVTRGGPVDTIEAIRCAAGEGHLAVVVWLVEELGVEAWELGTEVMDAAAGSGNVQLLGWLRERGCAWHDGTTAAAAEGMCVAAVEWLVERGCPLLDGARCYETAARWGDLAMVRCMRRLGVRWGPDDVISADVILDAPLDMLRWLVEAAGVPVDWAVALKVVEDRRWDKQAVRDWLRGEQRRQAVRNWLREGKQAVQDWLREGKRRQEGDGRQR